MEKQKFLIVDGNALIHRAYHALPPLSAKDGTLVNAVYGFTTILLKTLKDLAPTHAAVAFDLPGPTFRHELYKEYKATREKKPQELYDQIPLAKDVVRALGIAVLEKKGFEGDDVIATLAEQAPSTMETMILTGDMDTLQLVNDHTRVYNLRKGVSDIAVYDTAAIGQRFGLRPDQLIDYKALRGDPSDNIPGVRGIGEKTAQELLATFDTLENLYTALEKDAPKASSIRPAVRALLVDQKEKAFEGKKLVELVRDVPLDRRPEDCLVPVPDTAALRALFEQFGFRTLLRRFEEPKATPPSIASLFTSATAVVNNAPPLVQGKDYLWGHDLKNLYKQDSTASFPLSSTLFDTMIASHLLDAGSRIHDLETIAKTYRISMEDPSPCIEALVPKLKKDLEKQGLWYVFSNIEMPLLPILAAMEQTGILVDQEHLKALSVQFGKELRALTKKIYTHAGQEFNINSPLQLREILFEKMKLSPEHGRIRKTAKGGGASTAAGELEKLRGLHPIIDLLFDYRELAKLQSTYTDALLAIVDGRDGRVHTTYNQAVASTGRLSSSNPNLQNIPIRSEAGREIRKAFIAEKGYVLLSADYSQIELRVAATLSHDAEMIKAFKSGHDFHATTASLVFGVKPDAVTPEMRRNAKAINFGIIYGMGATSLSQSTGMNRSEAEQFIERYFEVFHSLRDYLEGLKEKARTDGYVETLFGRRRPIPEINSGVQQVRAAAERMAINMPIQGTATGDLMKLAMIALDKEFGFSDVTGYRLQATRSIRLLLQVHDELVFEIRENEVKKIAPRIKSIMENVHAFKVPIVADLKSGPNWGEMKPL